MNDDLMFDIFDENGIHRLEQKKPKAKTEINIDFINEHVKIYVITPKIEKSKEENVSNVNALKLVKTNSKHLIVNKHFKISHDIKSIFIDNAFYDIPCFYNQEMLKIYDENTWSMIFYQIFSNEILAALVKFKTLSKKKIIYYRLPV